MILGLLYIKIGTWCINNWLFIPSIHEETLPSKSLSHFLLFLWKNSDSSKCFLCFCPSVLQNKNQSQPHEVVDLEADEEEEEVGEEAHSPLEQDSLMPSDEASDSLSRGQRGSPSTRGGEEEEEEEDEYTSPRHTRTYRDMYPPHHGHTGAAHSANGHESQDRLLRHEAQQGHNQRNSRQRSRPWPRDTYWAEAPTSSSR